MNYKYIFNAMTTICIVVAFGLGSFIPSTLAANTVSIASDTAVLLSNPGITLILAGGSSLVSYSVDTSTLTVNLDAGSTVTVKSNDLYTLTNSQGKPTQCSGTAYSYVILTAPSPTAVTVTPTTTVACTGGTPPVISVFSASPDSITPGQISALSWSIAGATTVSIDHGIGSQSNLSSGSANVSPTQTTTYTLTATGGGPSSVQITVTVAAPQGGGGGSVIFFPTIGFFSALPASINAGQSSILSWSLTGASTVKISPAVSTSSLSTVSGTATVTPASTTTYTLVASNAYGQVVTATTTVAVMASTLVDLHPPTSEPTNSLPPSISPAYCLVNHAGTFSLILNGIRHGIANPGLLYSYGYRFGDAVEDTATYESLPNGKLLGPGGGALVKAPDNATVYLISGGANHGFTSASVFRALGYNFSSVLTIPAPQLDALSEGSIISVPSARHLSSVNVSNRGTVYLLGETARFPYTSLAVFNTWNLRNDFSRVVPANAADLALPFGPVITARSSCTTQ